jgi:hypothetical protein
VIKKSGLKKGVKRDNDPSLGITVDIALDQKNVILDLQQDLGCP